MNPDPQPAAVSEIETDIEQPVDFVSFNFGLNRRSFVQVLSGGLLFVVSCGQALAQRAAGRGGGRGPSNIGARVHIAKDGSITVYTGKTEMGQGARGELTQAAAEELRVAPERIQLIMADTSLVPDDGITAGSRSTPGTVPAVREGSAAAREALVALACERWTVERGSVEVRDGQIVHATTSKTLTYADLAQSNDLAKVLGQAVPKDISLAAPADWKVMGKSFVRPNGRDLVTGRHRYPSDTVRPGMLYGKVLRAPSYGAKLYLIDVTPAKVLEGVKIVQDGDFIGLAAPTSKQARDALEAIAKTAVWTPAEHPSSSQLYAYLREHVREPLPTNPFAEQIALAAKTLKQSYHVAYVAHAPLEPRAAVAEWNDGKLTVWAGTQNPFGYRQELMGAFRLTSDQVRVVVPDFGGGFGGKHTGEAAIEAARLSQGVGTPVCLRWTREEEFTWASFRPAGVIEAEASLDDKGVLTSWHFININSGPSAIETPYRAGKAQSKFVGSQSPLRTSSYRGLAATANSFARECFMDELAEAAGQDPLAFRLAHLENQRIRAVLETAAEKFGWKDQARKKEPNIGVGLACSTEKGSVVAACAQVEIDRAEGKIRVKRVCQAFECGPIVNHDNLMAQVQGGIVMGLGPALGEEMRFENGKMLNPFFRKYAVPRFEDLPELDIQSLDRPDVPPAGGGETPLIAIAPAIANAVWHATGTRMRQMPIRLPGAQEV